MQPQALKLSTTCTYLFSFCIFVLACFNAIFVPRGADIFLMFSLRIIETDWSRLSKYCFLKIDAIFGQLIFYVLKAVFFFTSHSSIFHKERLF